MDEPRASYTEGEKQISHTNAYIWKRKRRYCWTYLQGNNGDTDLENRLVDTVGEEEGGMNWENSIETHTLPYVK